MNDPSSESAIRNSDIALIGMYCRVPGARSIDEFWENLRDGAESIKYSEPSELLRLGISAAMLEDPTLVRASARINDIDQFDTHFFGIPPREAQAMDPQKRLFLEGTWDLLESAGYDPYSYEGSIGVYAGMGTSNYAAQVMSDARLAGALGAFATTIINHSGSLATLVSYKLNLRGPSITIQTACSTSLVSVHLACQSLLEAECDMAIAGGVSITLPERNCYRYTEGSILSPDGHCRTFDARANGTVPGSGVCIVLLKRLTDAISDGDFIHAVIKGSAINNDGSSKVGYAAPSVVGQASVITAALAMAEVDPDTITYIEAHGTGTALGDPIEVAALTDAFRRYTVRRQFCAIGSVKTNIGHLDAAAGAAALIKTALSLKHKQIPASLNFEAPNPQIDFAASPFFVNHRLTDWVAPYPRRAGVSSFGIGGTNAHVIVEEAPEARPSGPPRPVHLLTISARTENSLRELSKNLAGHLKRQTHPHLADIAYTLQVGRKHFAHRRIVVCETAADAISTLETSESDDANSVVAPEYRQGPVFLFPGQGTQFLRMGQELYKSEDIFREIVDSFCDSLKYMDIDLGRFLQPKVQTTLPTEADLKQTGIAQLALFVTDYALARLLMSWGITPSAMLGHSIGEYVCACIAGVMSEVDALRLVATRGRLMQETLPGGLLAIELAHEQVQVWLHPDLCVAAINGPSQCVVSGSLDLINRLQTKIAAHGIAHRRLDVSRAFHSKMMEPALQRFAEEVGKIRLHAPCLRYVSNVTGTWMSEKDAVDPRYWVRHLREPVQFAAGVQTLAATHREELWLEVGPGRTLDGLVRNNLTGKDTKVVLPSIGAARERGRSLSLLHRTLGKLWLGGQTVKWEQLYRGQKRHRVPLPTYSFERKRYWIGTDTQIPSDSETRHLSKRGNLDEWFYVPSWKQVAGLQPSEQCAGEAQWLIFVDTGGFGKELADALGRRYHNIVTVAKAESFIQLNSDTYGIRPQCPDDYEALCVALISQNKIPQRLVHLWTTDCAACIEGSYEAFSLMTFLAKSLERLLTETSVRAMDVVVISNGAHVVTGEERNSPWGSVVLGPCLAMSQENPKLRCRNIDLNLPKAGTWLWRRVSEAVAADLSTKPGEDVTAYRGQQRWIRDFERVCINRRTEVAQAREKQGTFVITGGLGRIGLRIAAYLARTNQAKLVLVGKSAFPEVERWHEWLESHTEDDRISRKIQELQAIAESGAEILVIRADSGDLGQMREAIARTHERFGRINGVIHCAGHVKPGSFQTLTEIGVGAWEAHFRSKVDAVVVLGSVLAEEQLDFCVLFSSLASVLGGIGYGAYAAANLFMDAYCQRFLYAGPLVWTSVNWDGWNFTDGGPNVGGGQKGMLALAMSPSEGIEVFSRILDTGLSCAQIVVSTGDLDTRLKKAVKGFRSREDSIDEQSTDTTPPKAVRTGYEFLSNDIERVICGIWIDLLGVQSVGAGDDFFEIGGDSFLVVRLISRLRDVFDIAIPIDTIFNHSTVQALAGWISDQKLKFAVDKGAHGNGGIRSGATAGAKSELVGRRIESRTRPVELPLSHAQARLWFIDQLGGGSTEYNMPQGLRMRGELDVESLWRAINLIVERHKSLRTRFEEVDGKPVQVIEEQLRVGLPVEDLSGLSEEQQQERGLAVLGEEWKHRFDLSRGPLLRVKLLKLGEREHVFLRTMHHIVSDGWSEGVFNRELTELYAACREGRENPLEPLSVQYADYALWQRSWLDGDSPSAGLKYWKEQLAGIPEQLELPKDRPRPLRQTFAAGRHNVTLPEELVDRLKQLGHDNHATLYMTLLAAFAVLMQRYSGQDDIVVGSPIANRQESQLEDLIGFFVNSLVMRIRLKPGMSFQDLLVEVRGVALEAYQHQEIPFERLVEELAPQRSLNTTPIVQVMFALQNAPVGGGQWKGLDVEPVSGAAPQVRFDLEVHASELRGELRISWLYNEDLFERWRIEQMARHYRRLLEVVVETPAARFEHIELLSPEERRRIVQEWNDTGVEFPRERCIHELFEEQVEKSPNAPALVFEGEELTYAELNRRANQLAHYLIELGVRPDARVALCVERGFAMVVALLGVLKAGGAYVPLDPAYPEERLRFMLEDSAPVVLLTQGRLKELFSGNDLPCLDLEAAPWRDRAESNPDRNSIGLTSRHLAYVIYTSGSTGTPKGVMVEHANVVRLFTAVHPWFHFSETDVWTFFHSYAFDFSVWEMWGALFHGGRLLLISKEIARSPEDLYPLICQAKVTILSQTPSAFRQLITAQANSQESHRLRCVVFGGEELDRAMLKSWYEQNRHQETQLINMYGITETTVHVTCKLLKQSDRKQGQGSPVGCPIPDLRIYILDAHGEPVPVGVAGELYVGGAGVARGYLNRAELTAERFLRDPFVEDVGARMYRTGDLGCWLPDGNIEFLGRNDFQVKIRGFRIELGEIEARLREHPGVHEAAVLAREDTPGDRRLVAYYTVADLDLTAEGLRSYLSASLPEYMVPAAYVRLASLPLTPNGKLERKALPVPEADAYSTIGYEPPQGEIETDLAAIWAEVLKLERVGRHDDFFQLGGHSLLAVRVITRIRQVLGLEVALSDLFVRPKMADFARSLLTAAHAALPAMSRLDRAQELSVAAGEFITATSTDGHKIASRDRGRTWFDVHTGRKVE